MKNRHASKNRLLCWSACWFWESHSARPRRVRAVSGFRSYWTFTGERIFVEDYSFWRTLWRALGMAFPACKRVWDAIERRTWEPRQKRDDFQPGM